MSTKTTLIKKTPEQLSRYIKKLIYEIKIRLNDPARAKIKRMPHIVDVAEELEAAFLNLSSRLSLEALDKNISLEKSQSKFWVGKVLEPNTIGVTMATPAILHGEEGITLNGVTRYLSSIIHEPAYIVESYLSEIFTGLYIPLHEAEINLIKNSDKKYIDALGGSMRNNKFSSALLKRNKERIELEAHGRVVKNWFGVAKSIAAIARRIHKGSNKPLRLFYISIDKHELDARVVIEDNPTRTKIISRLSDDKKGMNEWLNRLHL